MTPPTEPKAEATLEREARRAILEQVAVLAPHVDSPESLEQLARAVNHLAHAREIA